jgi:hypothetical protein
LPKLVSGVKTKSRAKARLFCYVATCREFFAADNGPFDAPVFTMA